MNIHKLFRRVADERGVALPLALLGLVAVSLLVTTALVTSANEVALSSAHQRGAQALYNADEALEGFVATRAASAHTINQARLESNNWTYTVSDGTVYRIFVGELYRTETVSPTTASRAETFSIVAEPDDRRGRTVGAMISVTRTANPQQVNVNSGLTLAVNTMVGGNATISDGSDGAAGCTQAPGQHAITHANEVNVEIKGNASDITGDIYRDAQNAAGLISYIFNGQTVDDLVQYASIRFGPEFGQPPYENAKTPSSSNTEANYNWGCPVNLMAQVSRTCPAGSASYFPVVAIDAAGGIVDITGDHGQGTLIVVNGTLRVRGNFLYEGIIIAEGVTQISGTPRIEGAVITMGDSTAIDPDDEATTTGTSVIRFNQCAVTSAQQGLAAGALDVAEQIFNNRTAGWFEVVR